MSTVRFDLTSVETESINGGIAMSERYAPSSVKESVTQGADSDWHTVAGAGLQPQRVQHGIQDDGYARPAKGHHGGDVLDMKILRLVR